MIRMHGEIQVMWSPKMPLRARPRFDSAVDRPRVVVIVVAFTLNRSFLPNDISSTPSVRPNSVLDAVGCRRFST